MSASTPAVLACASTTRTTWSDGGASLPATGEIRFEVSSEGIAGLTNEHALDVAETLLRCSYDRLQQSHPADFPIMYETMEGTSVPQFTPEALALFESRTLEFVEATAGE